MVVAQIKTERGRRQKKRTRKRRERQGNKKKTRRIFTTSPDRTARAREENERGWIKPEINCVIFSFHAYGYRRYTRRGVLLQSPPPPIVDPLIPFLHARKRRQSFLEGSSGLFYGAFSTRLGLGWYMKESAREIYSLYLSPYLSDCSSRTFLSYWPPLVLRLRIPDSFDFGISLLRAGLVRSGIKIFHRRC